MTTELHFAGMTSLWATLQWIIPIHWYRAYRLHRPIGLASSSSIVPGSVLARDFKTTCAMHTLETIAGKSVGLAVLMHSRPRSTMKGSYSKSPQLSTHFHLVGCRHTGLDRLGLRMTEKRLRQVNYYSLVKGNQQSTLSNRPRS